MIVTGPHSLAQIEGVIADADASHIRIVTVSFPFPLHSRHPDIQCHPTMLTKTPPNSTVLSA